MPSSPPAECKVTASHEKPVETYHKQTAVEAKTAPVEPSSPLTAVTKPVTAPAAFKVTSMPAVAAPVSFSNTLDSSPPKSVEVKTASSKVAPVTAPADDDLPPLIPPEKPIKMPVLVSPVKEEAKLDASPPKPSSEPQSVQSHNIAPVEVTKVATKPDTDIWPTFVPDELIKAADTVKSASVEESKVVAEASTAAVEAVKPAPIEASKPVIDAKVIPIEVIQPVAEAKPASVEVVQPVAEAKIASVEVVQPVAEAKPAPVEVVQPAAEAKPVPVEVVKPAKPEPASAELTEMTPAKGAEPASEAKVSEVKTAAADIVKPSKPAAEPLSAPSKPTPVEPAVPAPAPRKLTFAEAVAKPAPTKPEVEVVSTTPSEPVSSPKPAPTPAKTPAKVEPVIKNDKGILFVLLFCLHLFFQLSQWYGNV